MIDEYFEGRKVRTFKISDTFIEKYKNKSSSITPLGEFVFKRTYAREIEGKLESWLQCCRRVVEGTFNVQKLHCKQLNLPWDNLKAQKSSQEMFDRMYNMKWLPPGRGLWSMGCEIIYQKGSACLNNCGFVSTKDLATDFSGPFTFLMDMSMLGVGIGADVKGTGTVIIQEPKTDNETYYVEDSREGWVDVLKMVLESYVGKGYLHPIDYSKVRKKGEPIKGFGGTASGPQPLMEMIEHIKGILNSRIGNKITSTDIVDIFNLVGRCVVSGGVRRTAEIMFGEHTDEEFINLKNREEIDKLYEYLNQADEETKKSIQSKIDKHPINHHRWASNNSLFAQKGMDYSKFVPSIANSGEPGFIWLDTIRQYGRTIDPSNWKDRRVMGCNPCGEQSLEDRELCCLVETFPAAHEDIEDYLKTLKMAYLYAKTVTLISTHNQRTNSVMMRNRRIGCSQSGIIQAINKFGRAKYKDLCSRGYNYIQKLDEKYSEWLCVPRSKKTTSVKPSGTVSILANATAGIHYPQSEYYIRNVRISDESSLIQPCIEAGYKVNDCKYAPNTKVISFPVKEENFTKSKYDVSIWEQFCNARDLQRYWSDNQVSITVTFNKNEIKDIATCLEVFEDDLKSISLLPLDDHSYEQPPYEKITKEEYEDYYKVLNPIKFDNVEHEITEKFCDTDSCLI